MACNCLSLKVLFKYLNKKKLNSTRPTANKEKEKS